MLQFTLCILAFFTTVQCQLNGEFWWLNGKLNNVRKVRPDPPKIDVSDFQNDESAKIIFRDDDLYANNVLKPIKDRTSKLYQEQNKVVWPTNEHMKNHDVEVNTTLTVDVTKSSDENKTNSPTNEHMKNPDVEVYNANINNLKDDIEEVTKPSGLKKNDDVLVFFYPKKEKYVATETINNIRTEPTVPTPNQNTPIELVNQGFSTKTELSFDKLSSIKPNTHTESQNICTYVNKKECFAQNGLVYEYTRRVPVSSNSEPLICCILPIQPVTKKPDLSYVINFPNTNKKKNRYKRSDNTESIALKQRDFLLKRKFPTLQNTPVSALSTKIVTPQEDDYIDPYWNIKNTKFQNSNKPKPETSKYSYYDDYSDYDQEYADEVPRPGLVSLYSDHAKSPSSWSTISGDKGVSYGSPDDYDDVNDDDYSFGYSTIDPRRGDKTQKPITKPQKLTTSGELSYDAERQTINFQSNPDFQVFQGFKLLNLFRNTSKVRDKNSNKFTNRDSTEILVDSGEQDEDSDDYNNQLFNGCGKAKKIMERGNQLGGATNGSHPWLALVVLTKRRHTVLCYATLVHPRAAVTVADCVEGTSPRDISVIVGLWNLEDRSRSRHRVATVHVHPRYKPGNVEHNIAVLHWMRPLALGFNVQPACLGEPEVGNECKFFGWGRLDQGIQQARSRWQRVTIRTCNGRLSTNKGGKLPSESLCVTPRGTVTGTGAPLICDLEGHNAIVGVVAPRDNGYHLVPVRNWVMQSENLLSGD